MSTTTELMTAEDLLKLPRGQFRYELTNGELKQMSPAGHTHGRVAMRLAVPLGQYVEEHELGEVYAAETGFQLTSDPDTVRAPDVAFIRQERVDEVGDVKGYWKGAPDLAAEVISPSNTAAEMDDKVERWLTSGTKLLWVVSPKLKTVTVYRSLTDISVLTEKDVLDGEQVVPGFRLPVARLFSGKRKAEN
ncbi:MAG TPA: Uma2 family endonuclease [Pyrinomonadaceae bacterium]|nr:Uma2 family endonuclease [Pyrinomonadaceae bacterium]